MSPTKTYDLTIRLHIEANPDTFGYYVYYYQTNTQLGKTSGHSQTNLNEAIADLFGKLAEGEAESKGEIN